MIGVGKHINRRTVHHVSRSVGTINLSVGTPQEIASIFGLVEHRVDIDFHTRCFFKEGITHVDVIYTCGEDA